MSGTAIHSGGKLLERFAHEGPGPNTFSGEPPSKRSGASAGPLLARTERSSDRVDGICPQSVVVFGGCRLL